MNCASMIAVSAPVTMRMGSMFDVTTSIDSVVNLGNRIEQVFFSAVPMFLFLFFEGPGVEIQEVPSDELIRIGRDELSVIVVIPEPRLSDIDRSVFARHGDLYVVDRDLADEPFLQVRSGERIVIIQNHDTRFCAWR